MCPGAESVVVISVSFPVLHNSENFVLSAVKIAAAEKV